VPPHQAESLPQVHSELAAGTEGWFSWSWSFLFVLVFRFRFLLVSFVAWSISFSLFIAPFLHLILTRQVVKRILKEEDDGEFDLLLLETLGNSFEPIAAQLMPYFAADEAQELVRDFSGTNGGNESMEFGFFAFCFTY
jgi:hypothetical protein